jgi:hypothetical protein
MIHRSRNSIFVLIVNPTITATQRPDLDMIAINLNHIDYSFANILWTCSHFLHSASRVCTGRIAGKQEGKA